MIEKRFPFWFGGDSHQTRVFTVDSRRGDKSKLHPLRDAVTREAYALSDRVLIPTSFRKSVALLETQVKKMRKKGSLLVVHARSVCELLTNNISGIDESLALRIVSYLHHNQDITVVGGVESLGDTFAATDQVAVILSPLGWLQTVLTSFLADAGHEPDIAPDTAGTRGEYTRNRLVRLAEENNDGERQLLLGDHYRAVKDRVADDVRRIIVVLSGLDLCVNHEFRDGDAQLWFPSALDRWSEEEGTRAVAVR